MNMQVQACKDVIKLLYIGKGHYTDMIITQKNMIDFDASITDMNSIDRLSTSIVMLQSQANSTEQYR